MYSGIKKYYIIPEKKLLLTIFYLNENVKFSSNLRKFYKNLIFKKKTL